MKINTFLTELESVGVKKTTGEEKEAGTSGVNFADVLNQAAGEANVDSVNEMAAVSAFFEMQGLSESQNKAIAQGEVTLELLEHLQTMLENGESGDSRMGFWAESMVQQVESLISGRDSLDSSDPLRNTIDEIGILAAVEGAKISRGDYSS